MAPHMYIIGIVSGYFFPRVTIDNAVYSFFKGKITECNRGVNKNSRSFE